MNCDELKSLLSDYLDEEATNDVISEVEVHMKACGPCEVEVNALKKTILIYRSNSNYTALSEDARERLFTVLSYEYRQIRPSGSS